MNKLKTLIFSFLCAAVLSTASAQEGGPVEVYAEGDQLFGINYSIGFPIGEFGDFIEKTSWRGFNLEYDVFVRKNLSVGFHAGYALFNEIDERDSYSFERGTTGVAISAKLWKYTHIVPIHATARYYYTPAADSWLHLFGGVGIGTSYVNQEVWVGLSTIQDDYWKFSVSPEFGLDLPTGGYTNIIISGQYQYILDAHDSGNEDLTNLNLRVGFKKWLK